MNNVIAVFDGREWERWCCGECGVEQYVPKHWLDSKRNDKTGFHCINGHSRIYKESEADRLRRERDRLKQDAARLEDERRAADARARQAEDRERRLKRRISAGTCPCCQRSVAQLARHMKTKHPEYGKPNNVVALKA